MKIQDKEETMIKVGRRDIAYAIAEMKKLDGKAAVNDLAWGKELIKNSRNFYVYLMKQALAAVKSIIADNKTATEPPEALLPPSHILTSIFASVYLARGRTLPQIPDEFTIEKKDDETPIAEVQAGLAVMNPFFLKFFLICMQEYEAHPKAERIIYFLIKALVDELKKDDGEIDLELDDPAPDPSDDPFDEDDNRDQPHEDSPKPKSKSKSNKSNNEEKITFDMIGGQAKAKLEIMKLAAALEDRERYTRWGTRAPRGICLYGPPGNGKTLLARALACAVNKPFFYRKASELHSMWFSKSEQKIDALFAEARKNGGIIFIDEFDALGQSRDKPNAHDVTGRVVAALNTNMDGFAPTDKVVVIFATNRLEDLDKAVIRPGRVDRLIEVPLPDAEGRREIWQIHARKAETLAARTLFQDLDLEMLVKNSNAWSGADIAEIIRRALEAKVCAEREGKEPGLVIMDELMYEISNYERVREIKKKIGF